MVEHTQTIRRQQSTNCMSVFGHFVGLALKALKKSPIKSFWKILFAACLESFSRLTHKELEPFIKLLTFDIILVSLITLGKCSLDMESEALK